MTVSPAQASYLEYHIPADLWSVVIRAQSDDDLCGVMSLQELKVSISNSFSYFADHVTAAAQLCGVSVCVSGQQV